jgi:hypothetical protein
MADIARRIFASDVFVVKVVEGIVSGDDARFGMTIPTQGVVSIALAPLVEVRFDVALFEQRSIVGAVPVMTMATRCTAELLVMC